MSGRLVSLFPIVALLLAAACTSSDPVPPSATPSLAATQTVAATPSVPAPTPPTPGPTRTPEVATIAWSYDIPKERYAVVVADEQGVFAGTGTIYDSAPGSLIGLDPANGQVRWAVDYDCAVFYPVLDARTVYAPCGDGTITAFDRATGQRRWQVQAGAAPFAPAIGDGLIFLDSVNPDGAPQLSVDSVHCCTGVVIALDAATGLERWRVETHYPRPNQGDESYLTYADGAVYIATEGPPDGAGRLLAVDARTGSERWRRDIATPDGPPQVVDGVLYISANVVQAYNPANGDLIWAAERGANDFAVLGNALVGGQGYGSDAVFALDTKTGRQMWSETNCDCGFFARAEDGHMVVSGSAAIGLDPRTGIATWLPPEGTPGVLPVAIVENRVYVGGRRHAIVALDIPLP